MKLIDRLLTYCAVACVIMLVGFAIIVAKVIICFSDIDKICLITSSIVTVVTFVAFLVLLWIKKEMQPEEIKRDMRILDLIKQDKKDSSNEELFNQFEALKDAIKEITSTIDKIEKTK